MEERELKIKKRDGREVDYKPALIFNAVKKAMMHTELGMDLDVLADVTGEVDTRILKEFGKDAGLVSVEDIQDIVVEELLDCERKDVAEAYIKYREGRNIKRGINNELYEKATDILTCKSITNDNANIDQYSFSAKEDRIREELMKKYASEYMVDPEVLAYFEKNFIYMHDYSKYSVGMHNCLFADMPKQLKDGFVTKNGDVRGSNSISTAFQLVAVIFQCQSQVQFGGVGTVHLDTDLAPYVKKSLYKHFVDGMKYLYDYEYELCGGTDSMSYKMIEYCRHNYPKAVEYAIAMTEREGRQAAQALYHNLNTLESRAGSQVPFTSVNFGRDTSEEGRAVSRWMLEAGIDGIGKFHKTSIFPISIMQYKSGVNDAPGTPNYDLKKLAIEAMCKRIYPNWVNGDFTNHTEDPNNPDTYMATMGCRTMIGYDRFGMGYSKIGRGNIVPTTIIMPKLGIEAKGDVDSFWKLLDKTLDVAAKSLVNRYGHVVGQSPKSAPFMYKNSTMVYGEECEDTVEKAMKHSTLAIGYIGINEMCWALFGKPFVHDAEVYQFALCVVEYMYDYCKRISEEHDLNFGLYATPAESLCYTAMKKLKAEYGVIENVTDRDYLTNSHHVPVWEEVTIFEKLEKEAPFCYFATAGCITYVELDSNVLGNPKAIERIIDYAFKKLNIPYLAFNFPIDTCLGCNHQGEIGEKCPHCGSTDIERLRRVTGYLTSDYRSFNLGKQSEVHDRVKHL